MVWGAKQSVEIEFRVLVPDLLVGSVIGRGGEVVRRIRAETDARVKVFEARGAGAKLSCHDLSLRVPMGLLWLCRRASRATCAVGRPEHWLPGTCVQRTWRIP